MGNHRHCLGQGFVEVTLPESTGSDGRALRVLWSVKGLDFHFELSESNVAYLVGLFRASEPEEKKPKGSPNKRRRRSKRQRSGEWEDVQQHAEAEQES